MAFSDNGQGGKPAMALRSLGDRIFITARESNHLDTGEHAVFNVDRGDVAAIVSVNEEEAWTELLIHRRSVTLLSMMTNELGADNMTPSPRRRMTTLQAYAAHGSVSYDEISAKRFAEILKGGTPTTGEKVSVCQGLTEMPTPSINRESADELAAEVGITRATLEARCHELCGVKMGANAFPVDLPAPPELTPRK